MVKQNYLCPIKLDTQMQKPYLPILVSLDIHFQGDGGMLAMMMSFHLFGVMMIDRLNPLPKMVRKFKLQEQDKTQGNDFINHNLGPDAEQRYEMFHHFLVVKIH